MSYTRCVLYEPVQSLNPPPALLNRAIGKLRELGARTSSADQITNAVNWTSVLTKTISVTKTTKVWLKLMSKLNEMAIKFFDFRLH